MDQTTDFFTIVPYSPAKRAEGGGELLRVVQPSPEKDASKYFSTEISPTKRRPSAELSSSSPLKKHRQGSLLMLAPGEFRKPFTK
jgi:hypothetical protein